MSPAWSEAGDLYTTISALPIGTKRRFAGSVTSASSGGSSASEVDSMVTVDEGLKTNAGLEVVCLSSDSSLAGDWPITFDSDDDDDCVWIIGRLLYVAIDHRPYSYDPVSEVNEPPRTLVVDAPSPVPLPVEVPSPASSVVLVNDCEGVSPSLPSTESVEGPSLVDEQPDSSSAVPVEVEPILEDPYPASSVVVIDDCEEMVVSEENADEHSTPIFSPMAAGTEEEVQVVDTRPTMETEPLVDEVEMARPTTTAHEETTQPAAEEMEVYEVIESPPSQTVHLPPSVTLSSIRWEDLDDDVLRSRQAVFTIPSEPPKEKELVSAYLSRELGVPVDRLWSVLKVCHRCTRCTTHSHLFLPYRHPMCANSS